VIEKVVTFGPAEQVGILTLPSGSSGVASPAVLMWNVGLNHRVGPFRIYVDLSRRLAEGGFTAFRFDASGLGDSGVRREAVSDKEREDLDIADAMDAVTRRTGITSFVLVGFCSSVDAAHRVAVKHPRVVAVVHLEGYAFETKGSQLRRAQRWLSLRRWERRAWLAFPKLFPRLGGPINLQFESVYKRDYPVWSQFAREIAGLTQRGTSLLFVYAGGDTFFNYEGQFWEMFGTPELERRKVTVVYFSSADHTFFDARIREAVMARVLRFVSELPARRLERPSELPAVGSVR
jgi:pimeloyl-ACP methyl ester carboxylesterase